MNHLFTFELVLAMIVSAPDERHEAPGRVSELVEADLRRELQQLEQLLGDTRLRFRRHQTPRAASEQLMVIDREIRDVLARPLSPELQSEVRRLAARLRALDPH